MNNLERNVKHWIDISEREMTTDSLTFTNGEAWKPITSDNYQSMLDQIGDPFPRMEWRMSRAYYDTVLKPYMEARGMFGQNGETAPLLSIPIVFDERYKVPHLAKAEPTEATNDPVP